VTTEVSGSTPFREPGIAARTRPARSAPAPRWRFDAGQPCTVRDKEKRGAMRRVSFIEACLASVLLSLGTAGTPAMASTPVPVTIHSTVIVGPFTGTWSASGGISDSGTLAETSVNFVGNGQLHIVRDVTGSQGTFTLRIDSTVVAVEPNGNVDFTGNWVVIAGTGAYADLHGQGTRSAVAAHGVVTETLSGSVHFD